jgi:hypothetical protein
MKLTPAKTKKILEIAEPILLFVDKKPERTNKQLAEHLVLQARATIAMEVESKHSHLALEILQVVGEAALVHCGRCEAIAQECEDMLGEEIDPDLIDAYCTRHGHIQKLEARLKE